MSEAGEGCSRCGAATEIGQKFCGQCGSPLGGSAEERRWVTVLFADLVDFTSRSEDMDPEDVREAVHEVMTRLVPIVQAHGGWVNRVIGDCILAVFGAPAAHEDDPERAVRAGLMMRDEAAAAGAWTLRIGINSGDAMLGQVGTDSTVMGDAVNTASRLQTAARPGEVLVGDATRQACGPALRFLSRGELTVKGKQRPVLAYEALAADSPPTRRRLADTPLVGRARDLNQLADCWRRAVSGRRLQAAALVGEAGMGKSRLAAELAALVEADDGLVLAGRCLPYGQVLGYRALAEAVEGWAGIDPSDSATVARSKLSELTARLGLEATEAAEHLAVVAGLAGAEPLVVNQVRLHASVREVLEVGARARPICLLIDDLHWADQALLELMEGLVEKADDAPLLVVAAARPELLDDRPWWAKPHDDYHEIQLKPLDPMSSARLATALCSRMHLPIERAEEIERAAGGNPLFAEEVAAVLADLGEGAGKEEIPGTLKASIATRLDALPTDERGLLQLAGVVGLAFSRGAVDALGAGDRLDVLLGRLELRGLVHRTDLDGGGAHDDEQWAFKHGLIRDVAYEMLPRARRRELHGALVDWMARATGDRLESVIDLLAFHAMAAERFDDALGFLDGAAERARRAAAHRAEASLLADALEIAGRLGRDDRMAGLHARRGRAHGRLGAWADARRELEAALEAAGGALGDEERAEVEVELSEACFWLADTVAQRAHSAAALELADATGRGDLAAGAMAVLAQAQQSEGDLAAEKETFRAAIDRAGGFTVGPLAGAPLAFYLAGDVVEALALAEQAAAAADEVRDIAFTLWALSYLGLTLAANGRYAEADAVYRRARRYGDEHGSFPLTCRAVSMASGLRYDVGDTDTAVALAGEAVERAASVGFAPTLLQAKIDLLLAWARGGQPGKAERMVAEVDDGIATLKNWHEWLWRLRSSQAKAELALATGDTDAAVVFATEALERARRHGRRKYEADALAVLGRAAAGRQADDAQPLLRRALGVASQVSDPALILRVSAAFGASRLDDEEAELAQAAATDRMRRGLPTELLASFEAYRARLLAGG